MSHPGVTPDIRAALEVALAGRAEPLVALACCGLLAHPDCSCECAGCGARLCPGACAHENGKGCPACGAGATPSGEPEITHRVTPAELAKWERRITGLPADPPPPNKREEAIERMQRMLAAAKDSLKKEGPSG